MSNKPWFEKIAHQNMQKEAESALGALGSALTYLIIGGAAAAGAVSGAAWEKATEPTDTDVGNAQRAYAIANLKANIDSQRAKLKQEIRKTNPSKKSMRVLV